MLLPVGVSLEFPEEFFQVFSRHRSTKGEKAIKEIRYRVRGEMGNESKETLLSSIRRSPYRSLCFAIGGKNSGVLGERAGKREYNRSQPCERTESSRRATPTFTHRVIIRRLPRLPSTSLKATAITKAIAKLSARAAIISLLPNKKTRRHDSSSFSFYLLSTALPAVLRCTCVCIVCKCIRGLSDQRGDCDRQEWKSRRIDDEGEPPSTQQSIIPHRLRRQPVMMSNLIDAHWFALASQGNIYSMTKLCSPNSSNKLLVASLKRKIYSCEYHQTPEFLRPLVKELLFTYIPSGAEIISIDAYNKSDTGDSFVIGITIMKTSTDTMERYLNIYTEGAIDGEGDEGSSIEAIAQNCLMVELSYTPYHLYHTVLSQNSTQEVVWLISGSDYRIHMIREDKLSHVYSESSIEKYFPELHDIQAIALWINIYYYDDYKRRVTAIGCECGLVKVAIVNTVDLQISRSWLLRYDKPIPSVIVFPHRNTISKPAFVDANSKKYVAKEEDPELNIVVSSTNNAVVFKDILRHGMKQDVILSGSESSDCILCCCIADINMDGQNEILLGTYGQEVLIFALTGDTWELAARKLFDAPVHSISYMDITNDGIKELIVLTQRGVHILQHNIADIRAKWKERYRKLFDILAQK